ncbi:MAG: efflux RND transporter periplasmic adaptor subunit [Ruminococcus sp.]|nr:efflux RND transporter periplasmic adaptor subunit [Ruminococcus sp.]
MSKTNASGKKGSKIKFIIIALIVLIVIVFAVIMISSASMMAGMTMADVFPLEKKTIENTVSFSGIVESRTFEKVSADLQYNIDTVNVEVGDKVKAGDILATLNSDDLQDQIVQQQAALDNSHVNTEYSLSDAEKRYNEALAQIRNGTYPEIRNTKLALDNAEEALRKAKDNYDEYLEKSGTDKDTQLISAQKSVDSAKYEMDCAYDDYLDAKEDSDTEDYSDIKDLKDAYDDAKKEYDSRHSTIKNKELSDARDEYAAALSEYTYLSEMMQNDPVGISQANVTAAQQRMTAAQQKLAELEVKYDVENTEKTYEKSLEAYTKAKADIDSANETRLKNAERVYERAKTSYENALNALTSVQDGTDTSLKNYSTAVNDAQKNVDDAKDTYELALKNADSSLASLKAAADREKVLSENDAQLIALEILKGKLDDCVITAPCDGTVTAVNAIEGAMPTGVLFIIEDTDDLKMKATVKEYSVTSLTRDTDVTVTIPSLNDKEFKGVISKIAPTGTKGVDGKSDGTASFDVEVSIRDTKDTGVLIGMTSKCTVITGSAENVFAVGYDSIVEDADGSSYVFTPNMIDTATATAKKIPVEIGFESDAELEIISPELTEGMDIIANAGDLTDGGLIMISTSMGNLAGDMADYVQQAQEADAGK